MTPLTILWRGPLDSCNYACHYCPFAKRSPRRETLDRDRAALLRFRSWVEAQTSRQLSILITPWGEALVHGWYRDFLVAMSHAPQVRRVGIQTNGSTAMGWVDAADRGRLALWITWHPTEIDLAPMLTTLHGLHARGVRFSVGTVGVPEHLQRIEALRAALPVDVPCWVNALKPHARYDTEQIERFSAIDPRFQLTLRPHATRGRACRTGETAITVDGDGEIRRCHFVEQRLGNLYRDDLDAILAPRPCPRGRCDCYIGFAHLEHLGLEATFGDDLMYRIPHEQHA